MPGRYGCAVTGVRRVSAVCDAPPMLRTEDSGRVRLLTLDRPEALNAFNEALYDALADALIAAGEDDGVAVVVLTGEGRAFCAGTDLLEMAARMSDPDFVPGRHGFPGLIDQLVAFDKPILCAVNGIGLGIGATILGLVDLAFVSTEARLKCPFTGLGVAPEAASSFTFPTLMGRQAATWALMSSEWLSAEDCVRWGLALEVCPPGELLPTTMRHAEVLAAKPISSLRAVKRLVAVHQEEAIAAARRGEDAAFVELMGGPANAEALAAFAEKREPDFTKLPPGW
jgi:enoyl-CoA hydratase/carnithine racemase